MTRYTVVWRQKDACTGSSTGETSLLPPGILGDIAPKSTLLADSGL